VPVVVILVALVILGGVVVVAMGRGGELSRERPELPARSDFRTWSDVASYRPPPALLGYDAGATEHALSLIARTIAERDAEIDWLRQRLAEVIRPAPGTVVHGPVASGTVELSSPGGADAGPDADTGLLAGYPGVLSDSAPADEADLADDNDPSRNVHVRPSLSLGPRPGEGE
jgi:hypothetical protein